MNIDKSYNNSSCEPAATERRSKKTLTDYHRCTRSLWPRIRILIFSFWFIYGLKTDLQAIPLVAGSWPRISRIPRIYTMSQPKRFVRFVRFVFEKKHSRIYSSWTLDLSKTHWPKGSNLPNQTNHLICRHNQKTNPFQIPFVPSRHNPNQKKIKI